MIMGITPPKSRDPQSPAQKYQPKRLICVFQPHQASRTRLLLDEFAACFSDATETILSGIYFVRDSEADRANMSAAELVSRIKNNGQNALHLPKFEQIVQHLRGDRATATSSSPSARERSGKSGENLFMVS